MAMIVYRKGVKGGEGKDSTVFRPAVRRIRDYEHSMAETVCTGAAVSMPQLL